MNKKEFEKWVDETVKKYNADFKALHLYRVETGKIIEGNKIIVLDTKTGKTGMARCHKDDKFDFKTGLAIAYARLKGWKIPEVEEEPTFKRLAKRRRYWNVEICEGKAIIAQNCEQNYSDDDNNFRNNNYFYTKERAKEVADKINFLLKLERQHDIYCPDYKPDWENNMTQKHYVLFDNESRRYIRTNAYSVDTGTSVYFDSEETAQKVCDALNKELEMPF